MRWALVTILLLAACGETRTLVVELRTDYVASLEASTVQTRVVGTADELVVTRLSLGEDLLAGRRVAELEGLEDGDVRVRVDLLDGTRAFAGRDILVELDSDRVVTAVITRSCEGIECPEACLNGQCVDFGCTPETPERCPPSVECEAEADCAPPMAACLAARCVGGACLDAPRAGACGPDEWCDPAAAECAPLPERPDAGADAGGTDAGAPLCGADMADCNGDGTDGCEADLRVSHQSCGACGRPCLPTERCVARVCEPAVRIDRSASVGAPSANVRGFALDVQPDGRAVLAGKINGVVDAGPSVTLDSGGRDAGYLLVFGGGGVVTDGLVFQSSAIASANGVDLTPGGDVFMVGEVRGTLSVPGGAPLVSASIDPYWVHYDAALAHRASAIDGMDGAELGHDVAALPGGGAVVVGYVRGAPVAARAFTGPLPGAGRDAFVARVDANGAVVWVRFFGGPGDDEARGVDIVDGRVCVTGFFEGTATFAGPPRVSRGGSDVFVVCLSLDGVALSDVTGGGAGDDQGLGIAAHSSGDAIVVGEATGMDLGGVAFGSAGTAGDAFVARVAPDGAVVWVRSAGDDQNDVAHGVAVDGDAIFVTGYFEGDLPVDVGRLSAAPGTRSAYVGRLEAGDGGVTWAVDFPGGRAVGLGIGVDASRRVVAGGHFSGAVDFGAGPVSATGTNDGFVVRLLDL